MGVHAVTVNGSTINVTVDELAVTGPFGSSAATRNFLVEFPAGSTPTDAHALAAVGFEAGSSYMNVPVDTWEVSPVPGRPFWYYATAFYKKTDKDEEPPEEYTPVLQASTRGGRQTITQSLGTTRYAPPGQTAPDEGGAIGYDGERVVGIEIDVPTGQWSKTKRVAKASVGAFIATCVSATGTVNNATFQGYPAGSVKFLGADITQEDDSYGYFTLYYAYSENKTGMVIGEITGISKAGWDALDVRYADATDGNTLLKKPQYVYVHQVYPRGTLPE